MTIGILTMGTIVFFIFGSADIQKWNKCDYEQAEAEE